MIDYGLFHVEVTNGTERQFALINYAMGVCTFPWERLAADIKITFVPDPAPALDFEAAYCVTTPWTMPIPNPSATEQELPDTPLEWNKANYPSDIMPEAVIRIYAGLSDVKDPQYVSDQFFVEVVVHELAHVISGMMTGTQHARLSGTFGMTAAEYNPPATTRESWKDRGQEVFAETFKDLYLRRDEREYDNRTNHRVLKERLTEFYDILDEIVAYQPATFIFGGAGSYPQNRTLPPDPVTYTEVNWATFPFVRPKLSEIVGAEVWVIFSVLDEKVPGGVDWGSNSRMRFRAHDGGAVLTDRDITGPPDHNAFGPYKPTGVDTFDQGELLLDFSATIGPYEGSPYGGALVPQELIGFSTSEMEIIWWIGFHIRMNENIAPMPRPPYPYEEVGIKAAPGPAGTIRRSRP
jgi:hypothetical protein